MSDERIRMLHLIPPTGDGVSCNAIARKRMGASWSEVVPWLQRRQSDRAPTDSLLEDHENR